MKCDFDLLYLMMAGQLPLTERLLVLDHLDWCEICFDQASRISKERDARLVRQSISCQTDRSAAEPTD